MPARSSSRRELATASLMDWGDVGSTEYFRSRWSRSSIGIYDSFLVVSRAAENLSFRSAAELFLHGYIHAYSHPSLDDGLRDTPVTRNVPALSACSALRGAIPLADIGRYSKGRSNGTPRQPEQAYN